MIKNRTELAILAVIVILLGSLLSIAVSRAQIAARKMSSQNNLKHIGLAVHNFESAYRKLPPGCDEKENHGWLSFIFPYIEASPWFSDVDFDIAWEHPLNHHEFTISIQSYRSPSHGLNFTQEGYGITDYQANPALMYRGSKVKFQELSGGLSNIWIAGEINGDHKPFGYPFNWRELNQPINSGSSSFGAWADGANFVLADGSIRFIAETIDTSALDQLASAAPLPEKSRFELPSRRFTLTSLKPDKPLNLNDKGDRVGKGVRYSRMWFAADGLPAFIDFGDQPIEVDQVMTRYPQTKVLRIAYPKDSHELDLICSMKDLETLALMRKYGPNEQPATRIELDELLNGLQRLPKLKYLKLEANDEELRKLKAELPQCAVVPSTNLAPHTY